MRDFFTSHQFLEGSKVLQSFTISSEALGGSYLHFYNLNFCHKTRNLIIFDSSWNLLAHLLNLNEIPNTGSSHPASPAGWSTTPPSRIWKKAAEDKSTWHRPGYAPQHAPVAQQVENSPGMQPFPTTLLGQLPDQRFLWNPLPLLLPHG